MISDAQRQQLQVGFKQTLRAVGDGKAKKIFLALDCDEKISTPLRSAASEKAVEICEVPTMKELGAICGIEVSASCAAVLCD